MSEMALAPFWILPSKSSSVLFKTASSALFGPRCGELTLMRHDKDKGSGVLDSLRNIRNSHDIIRKLDVGEILLVDMGGVDDFCELFSFKLDI